MLLEELVEHEQVLVLDLASGDHCARRLVQTRSDEVHVGPVARELSGARLQLGHDEDQVERVVDEERLVERRLALEQQVVEGEAQAPAERPIKVNIVLEHVVGGDREVAAQVEELIAAAEEAHLFEHVDARKDAAREHERGDIAAVQRRRAAELLGVELERHLGKDHALVVEHEHGSIAVHVDEQSLEQMLDGHVEAVLVALEEAEERAGRRVEVHDDLEEVVGADVLLELIVAELDEALVALGRHVVRQVGDHGPKRLGIVDNDAVDLQLAETVEQLVDEAQCGIEVADGRHTPDVDDTVARTVYLAAAHFG